MTHDEAKGFVQMMDAPDSWREPEMPDRAEDQNTGNN